MKKSTHTKVVKTHNISNSPIQCTLCTWVSFPVPQDLKQTRRLLTRRLQHVARKLGLYRVGDYTLEKKFILETLMYDTVVSASYSAKEVHGD